MEQEEEVPETPRHSEMLMSVEKLGQNVFVLRLVTSRGRGDLNDAPADLRKAGKAETLEAIGDWMERHPTSYVEWAPKHIMSAASLELSELLQSPRDGAVASLGTRRHGRGGLLLSPSCSDSQSPTSSARSEWRRGSDDAGYSYEAAANDLLAMTPPLEVLI